MRIPFKTSADILGSVHDIDGNIFWTNEARATNQGFYIWFGWQENLSRIGSAQVALTQELADHLVRHKFSRLKSNLPLSDNPIVRFRKRMGYTNPRDRSYREWKKRTTPPPDIISDINGIVHRIVRKIPTPFGIEVMSGMPQVNGAGPGRGGKANRACYILTHELADLIRQWSHAPRQLADQLPFDQKTLHTMRRQLGLNWYSEVVDWWAERFDDLMHLPRAEFAALHGKSLRTIDCERFAILHVQRAMNNPDENILFLERLAADWSDKRQNVKVRLGTVYDSLQVYRRAWRILKRVAATFATNDEESIPVSQKSQE